MRIHDRHGPPAQTQLMLLGQAAAPEGPVDIAAMYVMHWAFRRELDDFADVVPTVAVANRARWALVARRFGFFATVLHKHHHGEDIAMWPLLAERGARGDDDGAARPGLVDACEPDRDVLRARPGVAAGPPSPGPILGAARRSGSAGGVELRAIPASDGLAMIASGRPEGAAAVRSRCTAMARWAVDADDHAEPGYAANLQVTVGGRISGTHSRTATRSARAVPELHGFRVSRR